MTTTPAPTNTPCVDIHISELFGCETAAMAPGQTLIARLPGDNGRFVRMLRDETLDDLIGVIGIDTIHAVRFRIDAQTLETMLREFPDADASAVPAEAIIARVAGDNGRWIHLLRDCANGRIVGVSGMDTLTAVRFHIDRQAMTAMARALAGSRTDDLKGEAAAH